MTLGIQNTVTCCNKSKKVNIYYLLYSGYWENNLALSNLINLLINLLLLPPFQDK